MNNEEKIIVATFLASVDVRETPLNGLFSEDLVADEAVEVWENGFIIKHDGKDVCIIPDRSGKEIKLLAFTKDQYNELKTSDWKPNDKELAGALIKADFAAPWVTPGAIKKIVLTRWGE